MKNFTNRWIKIPTLGESEAKEESESVTENEEVKEEKDMGFIKKHKKGIGIGLLALATGGIGYLAYKKFTKNDDDDDFEYEDDFEDDSEEKTEE